MKSTRTIVLAVACATILCTTRCMKFSESLFDSSSPAGLLMASLLDRSLKTPTCGSWGKAESVAAGAGLVHNFGFSTLAILSSNLSVDEQTTPLVGCRASTAVIVDGTDTSTFIYQFNSRSTLARAQLTGTLTITYQYRADGYVANLMLPCTDGSSHVISYDYGQTGQLTRSTTFIPKDCQGAGSPPSDTSVATDFTYGDASLPFHPTVVVDGQSTKTTTYAYTTSNGKITQELSTESGSGSWTTTSTYTYNGDRIAQQVKVRDDTTTTETYTFTYTYDAAGRTTSIATSDADTKTAQFTYTGAGNIDKMLQIETATSTWTFNQ